MMASYPAACMRLDGVDGGVVELDPLPDTDRPAPQHERPLGRSLRALRLVLLFVGRVEVGVAASNSAAQVSTIL